jgi:hypothetical protein
MGLTVLNLPCAAFHVGWRELMHILFIPQHNEIIIEARDGIEDQVKGIVKESVEEALKRIISEVTFIVEPKIADAWE